MKYIMLRTSGNIPRDIPIIFPDQLVHDDVAQAIKGMSEDYRFADAAIVSAGFCRVAVACSGKSETCGVGSRDCDDDVINTYDYTLGLLFD
ncbi:MULTISPECIES: hypothetical protein [Serratia]|uniref:hypothetical protein n=1 Tax=Serratia TaxID=613 RepID=UPI0006608997|nr:hypothetical protein [Serratia sp. 506_PEND]